MTQLITITEYNGKPVIESRLIAEGLGIQHKNLIETIRNYQTMIEATFGPVAFETELRNHGQQGGSLPVVAHLTKEQAEFLATLSRNTPEVVAFKAALVSAFNKQVQPALPQSYKQALLALVAAEEEKEAMQLQLIQAAQQQHQLQTVNHKLEEVIELQSEKVEFAESVTASDTTYTLSEAAKILETDFKGLGQNKLADFLRKQGRFMKGKAEPMQGYVGMGIFTIKLNEVILSNGNKLISKQTLITGKGLEYIHKLLKANWTK